MKERFNSRMIGTTLASAAMASVLVLGVAQADERQQAAGYGQGSPMGQQGPYGSGMGAHPGSRMMQQRPGYAQMPQFDPDNLPEDMPEEMREHIKAQHAERQERMEVMQAMREGHQKAMEAGRAAYEEVMERHHEQRAEMKQEDREPVEEDGDAGGQSGGQ